MPIRHQSITQANADPGLCHHMASLGHNELNFKGLSIIKCLICNLIFPLVSLSLCFANMLWISSFIFCANYANIMSTHGLALYITRPSTSKMLTTEMEKWRISVTCAVPVETSCFGGHYWDNYPGALSLSQVTACSSFKDWEPRDFTFKNLIMKSMVWCKRDVLPLLMNWSYISFA